MRPVWTGGGVFVIVRLHSRAGGESFELVCRDAIQGDPAWQQELLWQFLYPNIESVV
jgi:hypothetical protein